MSDEALRALAIEAGFQPRWTDNDGVDRNVSIETLRASLAALGLPAATDAAVAETRARLAAEKATADLPPLRPVTVGEALCLGSAHANARARVEYELGGAAEFRIDAEGRLPRIDRIGYHRLILGAQELTLAVAPATAPTLGKPAGGGPMRALAAPI